MKIDFHWRKGVKTIWFLKNVHLLKHVIHLKKLLKWYIFYPKQAPLPMQKKTVNFKGPSSGWKMEKPVAFLLVLSNHPESVILLHTPPKTNMEPKNWWFADFHPFPC